jgi:hypothetical protein
MTADEIRETDITIGLPVPFLLREIAAQLAELNESLKPLNIRDRTFEYPEGRR